MAQRLLSEGSFNFTTHGTAASTITSLGLVEKDFDMARIVIADDDEIIVEIIRAALERGGHVVYALPDGTEVGCVTDLKRPNLVILDFSMPRKSGIDALRDIRLSPISFNTPVLMLTGAQHKANEEIALRAGANKYLRKPFDPDELLSIVDVMLSRFARFHETCSESHVRFAG